MKAKLERSVSDRETLSLIMQVSRNLALPLALTDMLTEVAVVARDVLEAERCTVWLYDGALEEYSTKVVLGTDFIRIPSDRGLVGACGSTRKVINVPDCYADPRFDQSVDRDTGYRTRCMLSVPLIGYDDRLIGVMQVLNRLEGVFDERDVEKAMALSAQCAVALQRASMLRDLLVKERIEHELEVARQIQVGALPQVMPILEGYDIHGWSQPAEETGGDMFDIIVLPDKNVSLLLADATGHGVGPALSVMQVRSMLRMCARLDCGLHPTFAGINRQLVEDLPRERFVTAFIGQLDPKQHRIEYISGGQGPLMHFVAATNEVRVLGPTTMPLGIIRELPGLEIESVEMAPGDIFALITDGVFEAEDEAGEQFEEERAVAILREFCDRSMDELVKILHDHVARFTDGEPQADDITILLVKRLPAE